MVIELSVMIELVGVTRMSVILKLEAAVELFGTVTLASIIYGLPAPIDDWIVAVLGAVGADAGVPATDLNLTIPRSVLSTTEVLADTDLSM